MFCEKCGANIQDNNKFCPKCGNEIKNVPKNKQTDNSSTTDSLKSTWDGWSSGKKVIAAIAVCCIGLLLISSIMSIISPDANTSSSSDSNNYTNSDFNSDISDSDMPDSDSSDYSSSDSDYSYSSSSNGHDVHTHYEGEEGTDDTYGTIYDDGSIESHSTGHTDYGDYQIDSYMDSDGNIHGTADIGGRTYTI